MINRGSGAFNRAPEPTHTQSLRRLAIIERHETITAHY